LFRSFKTGYGAEDNHFVVELTYNYGIREYERGNDFNYLKVVSSEAIEAIKTQNYPHEVSGDVYEVIDPNGYRFFVTPNDSACPNNTIVEASLFSSKVETSVSYWSNMLSAKTESQSANGAVFSFDQGHFRLNLVLSQSGPINHAKAFGRIAFSCPATELLPLQEMILSNEKIVLTKYVELPTPGKANVCVVILADTDGHEICFVGDEGFRDLSQVDPEGRRLLDEAMEKDGSDNWHQKKAEKQAQLAKLASE